MRFQVVRNRRLRLTFALTSLAIGLLTVAVGIGLETRNPRTNVEDDLGWAVLGTGMFLVGLGASLPFTRPLIALLIGFASPFCAFWFAVLAFWTYVITLAAFGQRV
jgi:hypothetical protein